MFSQTRAGFCVVRKLKFKKVMTSFLASFALSEKFRSNQPHIWNLPYFIKGRRFEFSKFLKKWGRGASDFYQKRDALHRKLVLYRKETSILTGLKVLFCM